LELVIFTGFLGSGKTTIAMEYARYLTENGTKVAFVINEAGEIAIDSNMVRQGSYTVEEVFAGCICCQVTGDLVSAIKSIVAQEQPDKIIVEPSGIADPKRLEQLFEDRGYSYFLINVVDLARYDLLSKAAAQPIKNGFVTAHVIMGNKIDLLKEAGEGEAKADELLARVKRDIQEVKGKVPFCVVSSQNGIDASLWKEVMGN